jgi:hypothetical protein
MSYPINYPTPQGANVQMFYRTSNWVKPQGASFVWFTLIGGGGTTSGGSVGSQGGGSGAVTNCMVPAFLIPDILQINVSTGNAVNTTVVYQEKDQTGYTLLTANAANSVTGGAASSSNYFSCLGFFQSVAGQDGSSGAPTASSTTFLQSGGTASTVTSNYGYSSSVATGAEGFFMMQPIMVGQGSRGSGSSGTGIYSAIGCGSGSNAVPFGGPGLAVIITW